MAAADAMGGTARTHAQARAHAHSRGQLHESVGLLGQQR